jgi:hypothetical protein
MNSILLIGNGFAMLAAAFELGRKGQNVTLLSDGKPLGGHFSGLKLEGFDFDIGMVFMEESSASETNANLLSYDPAKRNDWTRFGDRASNWIRNSIEIVKAKTPECMVESRKIADYLISNRLDGLFGEPSSLSLSQDDPRHAVHKYQSGAFDTLTYEEAAFLNHGQDWHQKYIEPYVRKVFNVSSADFLARYHRAAWVPLYYPETLSRATLGMPIGLDEYPFWTTTSGFVGQLARNLCDTLSKMPNVLINTQPLTSVAYHNYVWTIASAEGKLYHSRKLAVGMTSERIGTLLNVPLIEPLPGASVSLLFATVEAERIQTSHGCTLIVEDTYAAYRLTDQDSVAGLNPSLHRIVLEASPRHIAKLHPGKSVEEALLNELAALLGMDLRDKRDQNAIRILKCFTAQNALSIPTLEQVNRASLTASLLVQAAPSAKFTGSLLGYGVASLNDQIIQALKISEELV